MPVLRIQKWFSQMGLASRREAQRMLLSGRIKINGIIVTTLGVKIDPTVDVVELDGVRIETTQPQKVVWLLNKPKFVITSRVDNRGRKTIYDLDCLKNKTMVFPVGRLDYDTEGLLLLSNDGELVHRLMHPRYKVPRHYYVRINRKLSKEKEERIRNGVLLDDGPSFPLKLKLSKQKPDDLGFWYDITIFEGRKRIIKRIFKSVGEKVERLIRYGFGDIFLPNNIKAGELLSLSYDEIYKNFFGHDIKK